MLTEKLDGKDDKKCKGIKKCVVKKTLDFDDYSSIQVRVKVSIDRN